jgi:hypothetical protein
VWLTGAKKGQSDTFADNLPGFPDNITYSPARRAFWVALGSPRDANVDRLAGRPFLRKVVMRLPDAMQPRPVKHSWALALDEQGQPVASLQQVGEGAYAPVASVLEVGPWLYLGSFAGKGVARAKAPPLPPAAAAATADAAAAVPAEAGVEATAAGDAGAAAGDAGAAAGDVGAAVGGDAAP